MARVLGNHKMQILTGQARPPPSVSQKLGPLGINAVQFFKEFSERTSTVLPNVPVQAVLTTMSDKTYKLSLRSPGVRWFLKRAARVPVCENKFVPQGKYCGNITLKEVYHIAQAKSMDWKLIGVPLQYICSSVIASARNMGIMVTKDSLDRQYMHRDDLPVTDLEKLHKEHRARMKAERRAQRK